jgi:hypothetical protein
VRVGSSVGAVARAVAEESASGLECAERASAEGEGWWEAVGEEAEGEREHDDARGGGGADSGRGALAQR